MLVCICSADCRRLSNPGSCVSDTKCISSEMKKKLHHSDAIRLIMLRLILTLQNQCSRVAVYLLTGIGFGR